MRKNKQAGESNSMTAMAKPIVTSSLIGITVTAVILLLLSFVLTVKDLPHSTIEPLALLASVIGSLTAGFICAKIMRKNGLALGALCGVMHFCILVAVSYLGTMNNFDVGSLLKALICIISGAIGGVLGVNAKHKIK